ncbi:hypothetical protein FCM35_KLT16784 [Carex littledalei]|uniref:Uncharacterized protein n=1 Tax=Carex littledalei TaxID=544730 RepID=A0A833VX88_9POAL|nr:hypothetical protein FCM35_KLT16784 [Carex littledalei]
MALTLVLSSLSPTSQAEARSRLFSARIRTGQIFVRDYVLGLTQKYPTGTELLEQTISLWLARMYWG